MSVKIFMTLWGESSSLTSIYTCNHRLKWFICCWSSVDLPHLFICFLNDITLHYRYNLSYLEQWLRDNRLQDCGVSVALEPIVQASQLLQARKTDADVDCICEMCSRLTTSQVSHVT